MNPTTCEHRLIESQHLALGNNINVDPPHHRQWFEGGGHSLAQPIVAAPTCGHGQQSLPTYITVVTLFILYLLQQCIYNIALGYFRHSSSTGMKRNDAEWYWKAFSPIDRYRTCMLDIPVLSPISSRSSRCNGFPCFCELFKKCPVTLNSDFFHMHTM